MLNQGTNMNIQPPPIMHSATGSTPGTNMNVQPPPIMMQSTSISTQSNNMNVQPSPIMMHSSSVATQSNNIKGQPSPIMHSTSSLSTPAQRLNEGLTFHADTPTVSLVFGDKRCQICVDRDRDAFIQPCGHTFCLVCALQVESLGQTCPSCRGEIERVSSMFY